MNLMIASLLSSIGSSPRCRRIMMPAGRGQAVEYLLLKLVTLALAAHHSDHPRYGGRLAPEQLGGGAVTVM